MERLIAIMLVLATGCSAPEADGDMGYVGRDVLTADVAERPDRAASADEGPDLPLPLLVVVDANIALAEGEGPGELLLHLSERPSTAVTVVARSHADITTTPVTIEPDSWAEPHSVAVAATDDPIAELWEEHEILLDTTSSDPRFEGLSATFEVSVRDNDVADVVVGRPEKLFLWDAESTRVEVSLATPPVAPVLVEVLPPVPGDYWPWMQPSYAAPLTMMFDDSNWDQPQSIRVGSAYTGSVDEWPGYDWGFRLWTDDPAYATVSPEKFELRLLDDAGLQGPSGAGPSQPYIFEGGPPGQVRMVVDLQRDEEVTVHFRATDDAVEVVPNYFRLTTADCPTRTCDFSVDVVVEDDAVVRPKRPMGVEIRYGYGSDSDIGHFPGRMSTQLLWVVDNDSRSLVRSLDRLEVNETRAPGVCVDLVLSVAPTARVELPVSSSEPSAFQPDETMVVFEPGDWFEERELCIRAVDDDVPDGDQRGELRFGPANSSDPGYADFVAAPIEVTVTDDESPGFTLYQTRPFVMFQPHDFQFNFPLWVVANTVPSGPFALAWGSSRPDILERYVRLAVDAGWGEVHPRVVRDSGAALGTNIVTLTGEPVGGSTDYQGRTPPTFDVIVINTDVQQRIALSTWYISVSDAVPSDVVTVVLSAAPSADVVVPVAPNSSMIDVSPASITFTTANWDVPVEVTVSLPVTGTASRASGWVDIGPAVSQDPAYDGTRSHILSWTRY